MQTLFSELAVEFDVEKNKVSPEYISPKDTDLYWWTCVNNHPSFLQSVEHRVSRKSKCPYCTGRKAVAGVNDLNSLFPDIAKEWDADKNNGVMPSDVPPFTYKSFFWICPKGHSYKKKVIQRTKFHKAIDCPKCIKAHSTSFPEQAIYYYVKKCFPDAINRYKEPFEKGMELDIYVPLYNIGIEYDGLAFHNDEKQHKREYKKYLACKALGIKLIRIKESKDTWSDTADEIFIVEKRMKDTELSSFLCFLFSSIFLFSKYTFDEGNHDEKVLNRLYGFPTDFNVSRDRGEILEYLVDVNDSFGVQYPELASLWSAEDNGVLSPFMFRSGSNYQPVWKCPICSTTWRSPISSIVSRNVHSCRACSMRENGLKITNIKTVKNGSLAEKSELLLRQWDNENNGNLSPYEIPINYSKLIAWRCDICGYRWSSSPNSRVKVNNISDCPHCSGRVAMAGIDDLETLYPSIAKEWDYEKNEMLPSQIRPHANKKFYWICTICKKSYRAYPGNRVKGSGCPDCAHKEIGRKNSKLVGQFNEAGEILNTYQGLHEAARQMQVGPNAIFQAVKTGGKSKGYYWRYIVNEE